MTSSLDATPSNASTPDIPIPSTFHTKLEDIAKETVDWSNHLLNQPLPDALDFSSYAPKKVASDLHNRLLPQLECLDRLTDEKIKELVRERLSSNQP